MACQKLVLIKKHGLVVFIQIIRSTGRKSEENGLDHIATAFGGTSAY
jgi:hypothetical protein